MPYKTEWVEPEIALQHYDVTIYHLYKDDEIEQGPRTFTFSTSEVGMDQDDGGGEFDVRDLPNWCEMPHPPFLLGGDDTKENREAWVGHAEKLDAHILQVIKDAIIAGYITKEGVNS